MLNSAPFDVKGQNKNFGCRYISQYLITRNYSTLNFSAYIAYIFRTLVISSMGKVMVGKMISELRSVSRLKIFPQTVPWAMSLQ